MAAPWGEEPAGSYPSGGLGAGGHLSSTPPVNACSQDNEHLESYLCTPRLLVPSPPNCCTLRRKPAAARKTKLDKAAVSTQWLESKRCNHWFCPGAAGRPALWHLLPLQLLAWVAFQVAAPSFLPANETAHPSATSTGGLRRDQARLGVQTDT